MPASIEVDYPVFSELDQAVHDKRNDPEYNATPEPERLCACGCGTVLPDGYKLRYIRGHKLASMAGKSDPEPSPLGEELPASLRPSRITKKVRAEIQAQVALLLGMVTVIANPLDPYCVGAVGDNVEQISEALVPILAKSPRVVRFMTTSTGLMEYAALAAALKPVAVAVYQHHFAHTVPSTGAVDNSQYSV